MTIELSHARGGQRRVVLTCDTVGCLSRLEPPAAEQWRSDLDARSWARDRASGWTHNPARGTDYCPAHTELSPDSPVDPGARPTATIRDRAGNPLSRDQYAVDLRARLAEGGPTTGQHPPLSTATTEVVARLLDELAGVYRGEQLGALAGELSALLDRRD